ncbi:COX assembly mitochondrial protein [Orchesella cincta]|uniref:COX assembly mitochondrial protein n=1 Tax=Orchesella cincta TaxID=48709 RepID=A0A1D2MQQ0_ORCCI|nr:COX assembly mitochondrial protein [Orchesella cincta]
MAYQEEMSAHPEIPKPRLGREPTGDPKNPFGLGDPDDLRLRKVEKEIMIPMKMREKAKVEKCPEEVQAFTECCKLSSVAMVLYCRNENTKMKSCLTTWYNDEGFKKLCTDEYLKERAEYRRTGIKLKDMKKYLA